MLYYCIAVLCLASIQTGAQFAHFPATGGARKANRVPSRPPPAPAPAPARPSPSAPTRYPVSQVKNEVDYDDYDAPVVRKPIPRNRGRGSVNSRSQSLQKKTPRKPVTRDRPKPVIQTRPSSISSFRSQTSRETAQPVPAETPRSSFVPEFNDQQFEPATPFTQFLPRIEQGRVEDTTQAHRLSPAVEQQQVFQPQPPPAGPAVVPRHQTQPRQLGRVEQQQARQATVPAQGQQPVFDSLFSNTVVSPQEGEQGEGVYFSYTATLGY